MTGTSQRGMKAIRGMSSSFRRIPDQGPGQAQNSRKTAWTSSFADGTNSIRTPVCVEPLL